MAVGALEHLDDTIANSNGVQQRPEVQRILLYVGKTQVVRHRAQSEYELVVRDFAASDFDDAQFKTDLFNHPRTTTVRCRLPRKGVLI